jgi:eukaryotic translation initiation factor 2C
MYILLANGSACKMVQELVKMMVERLQAYEKKTGVLPDRIIVYRDGVSEVSIIVVNITQR